MRETEELVLTELREIKGMIANMSASPNDLNKPLDMEDAANYLGISRRALYKLTSKKALAYFKSRGKNYFDVDDLNRYLRKERVDSTDEIKRAARDRQS